MKIVKTSNANIVDEVLIYQLDQTNISDEMVALLDEIIPNEEIMKVFTSGIDSMDIGLAFRNIVKLVDERVSMTTYDVDPEKTKIGIDDSEGLVLSIKIQFHSLG